MVRSTDNKILIKYKIYGKTALGNSITFEIPVLKAEVGEVILAGMVYAEWLGKFNDRGRH